MAAKIHPYIIFLPKGSKHEVLKAIFGSQVSVDILRFALKRGVSEKIYQKDLIKSLGYSNKTIIECLKALTELGILDEHMEKAAVSGRTVWLKSYTLTELGRWFALLLVEEENLPKEDKVRILYSAFRSYMRWIKEFTEKIGASKEDLLKIFEEEMERRDF